MADNLTKEQRSRNMSRIRAENTASEVLVRKYLHSRGLRYRINVSRLPGRPDIVLPKHRAVVFVNGCFWHMHSNCRYSTIPKTKEEYWTKKLEGNRIRDDQVAKELVALGWRVFTIWECELKKTSRQHRLDYLYNCILRLDN